MLLFILTLFNGSVLIKKDIARR